MGCRWRGGLTGGVLGGERERERVQLFSTWMIAEDQKSKTKKLCSATRLTISMSASGDLFDLYFPICSISSPPHRAPNFCKFGVSSGSWIVQQSVGKKGCLTG